MRQNYIDSGSIDDDILEASTINGYISGTGDKYASYIAPSAYYELQQTQAGVILGAGFEAEEDSSGYLKITTVYKGSSAELNGVLAGDIITAIDGKSLLSMQQGQAMERLSGEVGTRLALQLLRDGESISVNLVRQQLEIESVSTRMIDNIGYIQITSFNAKTAEQFANAMTTMNAVGAKALIETDSTNSVELPIAVLVDGGTVSAAELFAAVLRDEAGALIVGSQTFGKGVMQNTYEFSDGSALTLSVGKIYTKSGTWNETGLKPDYSVELAGGAVPGNISDDADSQLQKAIEVLTPKIAAELQ